MPDWSHQFSLSPSVLPKKRATGKDVKDLNHRESLKSGKIIYFQDFFFGTKDLTGNKTVLIAEDICGICLYAGFFV